MSNNQKHQKMKTYLCKWFEINPLTFKRVKLHSTEIIACSIADAKRKLDRHDSVIHSITPVPKPINFEFINLN
jgi:hypothetical protein